MQIDTIDTQSDIATVEDLARAIWTEHFTEIIGSDQVEYMLGNFQSQDAIAAQINDGYHYYLMREGDLPIGYFSIQPRGEMLFLSKIYLLSQLRGKGYARLAMNMIEKQAEKYQAKSIFLTVNRDNKLAIAVYQNLGFSTIDEVVQDIGGGFVMDDYVMEKRVD